MLARCSQMALRRSGSALFMTTTKPVAVITAVRIIRSQFSSSSTEDTVVSRCTSKISALLKPLKITVTSNNDDPNGSHINVLVISDMFEGKSPVQRQKLVFKAIWEELEGPVHAVDQIIAKTPKEVGL
jgi:stress-induced morphogen